MDLPTTHYESNKNSAATSEMSHKAGILSKISFYLLIFAAFFSPLIFIPSINAPLDVVKSFFICGVVLISSLIYFLEVARNKSLVVPRSNLGSAVLLLFISTILSAVLSANPTKSFFGQGFELTTASFILIMILASFLVSRFVLRDREVVFKMYGAILIAFALLALFHLIRFFGGAGVLSFNLFTSVVATVVGKWYDFGALAGIAALLSLAGIKFLPLRKGLKILLSLTLLVSGFILVVINAFFIWITLLVAVVGMGVFEYMHTRPKTEGKKTVFSRISLLTVAVVVIIVAFAWKRDMLALPLVTKFNAQYNEIFLPWQMTLGITSDSLQNTPFFGTGPNTFGLEYLLHKPLLVNQTPFWATEFTTGFGLIPTMAATQGIIGIIVWIILFCLFVREGMRLLARTLDPVTRFFATSSFFTALFLWMVAMVYTPSHVTVFFLAIFSGILFALLVSEGVLKEKTLSVSRDSKMSKLIPVVSYVLIVVLLVWLGLYTKKAIAITYFEKGLAELRGGSSTDVAEMHFKKALSWYPLDVYYQALSETNVIKINQLVQKIQSETKEGETPDKQKTEALMTLVNEALGYTAKAQEIDPRNYYNYIAEAHVSELRSSLGIQNAFDDAKNAYIKAIQVNPYNPSLYLSLAQLEASQKKFAEAQQYIGNALQLKQNYTDAVFLLSQIQVANNQIKDAITSTQVAVQLNPTEPLLYFQLGLLSYSDKDYTKAVTALEKAVELNNQYANARYFLGLSYARLGRNADAITQFEEISKTNSDNAEVNLILKNLKEGKSPFTNAQPPIDNKPEQRKTLPVAEKSSSSTETTSTKSTTETASRSKK